MQSTQEHRQQIIHENISKLIKTLTGFNVCFSKIIDTF